MLSYAVLVDGKHFIFGTKRQCNSAPLWPAARACQISARTSKTLGHYSQWLFLVPLKGGRDYIIPQLAGKIPLILTILLSSSFWRFRLFLKEVIVDYI